MSPPRPVCLAMLMTLLVAAPATAQDLLPAGSPIEEALGADITESGMGYILGSVGDFLPPDLVVGTIPSQEIADLFFCTQDLELQNLVVHSQVDAITIDGTPAGLNLVAEVNVWINTPDDAAIVILDGCFDYVCLLHTDPALLRIELPITMALSADDQGDPFVDVVIGELGHNIQDAMSGNIHLTGCTLGDIAEILPFIYDYVIDQLIGEVEGQINDATADLEVTLEDAMRSLWLSDTTDVLDTQLTYDIHPTDIDHNDHGLRLVMGGSVSAPPAQCVSIFGDDGSVFTNSNMPAMTPTIPGSEPPQDYHAAALISDDLINQAAYAAWRGGVLCYVVEDLGDSALDATFLPLLVGAGDEAATARIDELYAPLDETPMLIRTVPETPPIARFDGPHDIDIDIVGLNMEFYPEIYGRYANLVSVAVDISAGIDVSMAPDDALQLDVYLDTDNLNTRVTYNELAPDLNAALEQNFANFLGVVIDMVAGSFLEGMKFSMPTFSGMGLVGLEILPVGESVTLLDFLGAYALIGETDGGEGDGCSSCGDTGGCADCGGEEGCGGEEACDVESLLGDSDCTGEPSDQPDDTGCQGCKLVSKQVSSGHWRVVIDHQGTHHRHSSRTFKVGLRAMLLVLGPVLFIARRRRSRDETTLD